jgi:predicted ester cyclase
MNLKPYLIVILLSGFVTSATSQTSNDNKAIVLRYFEDVLNKQNLEVVDEIFSQDYKSHWLLDKESPTGNLQQLKTFLPAFFLAFPDLHYTVADIIAENDKVVVRLIFNATHKGEIFGVKPNGYKIDYVSEVFFFRVENGKIAEGWVQVDMYGLLRKLRGE